MKLSIIVAIYNEEKYLADCLDSIIKSDFSDFELILVNDGSSDNSGNICCDFAKKDDRIVIIEKENEGLVAARKSGVEVAKGQYITFVDADDWIDGNYYSQAFEKINEYSVDILCTGIFWNFKESTEKRINLIRPGLYGLEEIKEDILPRYLADGTDYEDSRILEPPLVNKIFRAEVIKRALKKVSSDIVLGEDAITSFVALYYSSSMYVINEAFYHYRITDSSMSKKRNEKALDLYPLLLKELVKLAHEFGMDFTQIALYSITKMRYMLRLAFGVESGKTWQFPFNSFEKNESIIIYGAGQVGKCYYEQAMASGYFKQVIWTDSNEEKCSQDPRLSCVTEILTDKDSKILIAVLKENIANEIRNSLIKKGFSIDRIVWIEPKWIKDSFSYMVQ